MSPRFIALLVALVVVSGTQLAAHHSHASTYFEDRRTDIEGDVVQVSIRNPHSWVHVKVKQANGSELIWAVEWAAGAQLNRVGITGKTLKAGDRVKITGAPGRNPNDHRLEMIVIRRMSDGWTWGTLPGEVVG
ncbi:MAG: hypothetical protein A3G76_10790 [Acidobacteria bacterium RIFCSPLOWO2_12_FULL_65_11]|nr:MAG: hypothetical protein A3H95_00245 [Acidobacteria bacterium RIFCSPLOWO2_02_FULL_64_15]OFW29688.1 MAG: hypothetical protein A3G76_10790 [Acidobacteria bacterium RIFCSPLOWO2_12_FULL_65_11]